MLSWWLACVQHLRGMRICNQHMYFSCRQKVHHPLNIDHRRTRTCNLLVADYVRQSKPNALPLRQVAIITYDWGSTSWHMSPSGICIFVRTLTLRSHDMHDLCMYNPTSHYFQTYPSFPGTTPYAAPPLPNIFLRSSARSSGLSWAAKCPPLSWEDWNTTLPIVWIHLEEPRSIFDGYYGRGVCSRQWRPQELHREVWHAERNGGRRRVHALARVLRLVVDTDRCRRARAREPVDWNPCEHCVPTS